MDGGLSLTGLRPLAITDYSISRRYFPGWLSGTSPACEWVQGDDDGAAGRGFSAVAGSEAFGRASSPG